MALGSLAFVPFTEQYARESTPPEVWHKPAFRRIGASRALPRVVPDRPRRVHNHFRGPDTECDGARGTANRPCAH